MFPEQIIAATDFSLPSESVLGIAARLAVRFRSKVVVLHVFEQVAHHHYQIPVSWMIAEIRRDIDRQLARQVKVLTDRGIAAEAKLVHGGLASTEILKTVSCYPNPLLVMGTHARSGMERFLLGSTAEEVLRQAPCAVITVGPHLLHSRQDDAFQKLLFATDFSRPSLAAAPFAEVLWRSQSADLTVLHVSTDPKFQRASENSAFDPLRDVFRAQDSSGRALHYITLHGRDVSQVIVNEAEQCQADLIVLGVRRGAACTPRLAGKIAFQIIAAAPCAVLTVSSDARAHVSEPSDFEA
jgi:nucleotide-binding universal stress UspA family protein